MGFDSDMPVAFAIKGELCPDRPPATAEEYLQQVRWEANRIDDVVVAKDCKPLEESNIPVHGVLDYPKIPKIPEGMKPTKEWENNFIKKFISLKEEWNTKQLPQTSKLDKIPPVHSKKLWRKYCFIDNHLPLASTILQLDFVGIETVCI